MIFDMSKCAGWVRQVWKQILKDYDIWSVVTCKTSNDNASYRTYYVPVLLYVTMIASCKNTVFQ